MQKFRDWSQIEWITLRAEFINALYLPKHTDDNGRPNLLCTCETCSEVPRLANRCGLDFYGDFEHFHESVLEHMSSLEDHVTNDMRDALLMVRTAYLFGMFESDDILRGYLEVPMIVGEILSSEYFTSLSMSRTNENAHRRFTRELVTALVEVALPDSYFNWCQRRSGMTWAKTC